MEIHRIIATFSRKVLLSWISYYKWNKIPFMSCKNCWKNIQQKCKVLTVLLSNVYWCSFWVWICWNWKHKINKWCELWYLLVKFYCSDRLLTSVLLCVVLFNVTFVAPLVTAVTYVFVIKWVNLEKVLKFIFINK